MRDTPVIIIFVISIALLLAFLIALAEAQRQTPEMLTPERNITPAFRRLLKRTFPAVGTLFTEWAAKSQIKFIFDVRDAPWHTDKKTRRLAR